MRFYTQQHRYTCGIDLHARSLYVCILDDTGQVLVHKNVKASPEALSKLIAEYRNDLIIGVECMFSCIGSLISAPIMTLTSSSAMPCT